MSKPAVEVQVRAVIPTSGCCAVFLGNGEMREIQEEGSESGESGEGR